MAMRRFMLSGSLVALFLTGCGAGRTAQSGAAPSAAVQVSPSGASPATTSTTSTSTATISPPPASSVPSSPPTSATVTLPISIITPTFGGSATAFSYPATVTVTAPIAWASQLQAVGAVGFVAIVPKGWTGQALLAADGSRGVALYPAGGSASHGPRLTIETAANCEGCAWTEAYPYFSWVQQHFQSSWGYADHATPIPGYAASPDMRFYTAPDTPNGYHVSGIAYAPFIVNPQGLVLFRKAQVVLPPGEHSLASVMLNELLSQIEGSTAG